MTDYPVTPNVAQYPCKCGHKMADHEVSRDLTEKEPCRICQGCTDFWADFEGESC
jgi:hypothetical protein